MSIQSTQSALGREDYDDDMTD